MNSINVILEQSQSYTYPNVQAVLNNIRIIAKDFLIYLWMFPNTLPPNFPAPLTVKLESIEDILDGIEPPQQYDDILLLDKFIKEESGSIVISASLCMYESEMKRITIQITDVAKSEKWLTESQMSKEIKEILGSLNENLTVQLGNGLQITHKKKRKPKTKKTKK